MKLKEKVAIVTGGSQGIGEAICHAYAKEGAIVIVVNKNQPKLGVQVAESIINNGGLAEAIECDITNEDSVNSLIKQVIEKYDEINILVNNAGVAVFKNFEDHTLEDWNYVMDVNIKGAFLVSRAVVPQMKKQKHGKIIFIASIAATKGFATIAPFSASKGAMISMAKSMVAELSRCGINVNTISPGSTETPTNRLLHTPKFLKAIESRTASGHPMQTSDMVGAAVFLASDESGAIHGLDIPIDNAWNTL